MPQLSKSTQTSLSEINMVPFVDVVLVLLITRAAHHLHDHRPDSSVGH